MEVMREIAALAVVLGLLAATLWRLRRRGLAGMLALPRSAGRRLQGVERLGLGAQHSLHLVRLGNRALLVASYPSGCALIESFPWHEVDGPREPSR